MSICPLCSQPSGELHVKAEELTLRTIQAAHPEWVASDGSCAVCLVYYRNLSAAGPEWELELPEDDAA